MAQGDGAMEKLQAGFIAILLGYFLLKFFDAFPDLSEGPFSGAYWILQFLPWLLVILGVVILFTMVSEVLDL